MAVLTILYLAHAILGVACCTGLSWLCFRSSSVEPTNLHANRARRCAMRTVASYCVNRRRSNMQHTAYNMQRGAVRTSALGPTAAVHSRTAVGWSDLLVASAVGPLPHCFAQTALTALHCKRSVRSVSISVGRCRCLACSCCGSSTMQARGARRK